MNDLPAQIIHDITKQSAVALSEKYDHYIMVDMLDWCICAQGDAITQTLQAWLEEFGGADEYHASRCDAEENLEATLEALPSPYTELPLAERCFFYDLSLDEIEPVLMEKELPSDLAISAYFDQFASAENAQEAMDHATNSERFSDEETADVISMFGGDYEFIVGWSAAPPNQDVAFCLLGKHRT